MKKNKSKKRKHHHKKGGKKHKRGKDSSSSDSSDSSSNDWKTRLRLIYVNPSSNNTTRYILLNNLFLKFLCIKLFFCGAGGIKVFILFCGFQSLFVLRDWKLFEIKILEVIVTSKILITTITKYSHTKCSNFSCTVLCFF